MVTVALAAGCSSSSSPPPAHRSAPSTSAAGSPAGTPAGGLGRFNRQRLDWHDCSGGFDCASLTVPVDYRRPGGATMKVAVIRKPATGPRHGSLIVNPGGPGASGVDYVRNAAGQFSGVTGSFDLVSFDPRGVGGSRPVRCLDPSALDAYIHVDPTPDTPAEHRAMVAASRRFAAACYQRNGSYLEHIGTIDAARDMDVLRAALGDRTLTYYGASYGTYLGAKYAQLFPRRIRAMVLDGALDPRQPTMAENRVQAIGFETNLRDFLANCAGSGSCPLGSTETAAEHSLDGLAAQVDAHPIAVGSRSLGPGEFFEGLALGLYSTSYWPYLRRALGSAENGDGSTLLAFSDALTDRHSDGTYGNLVESNLAINCIDRPAPQSVGAYDRAARAFARVAPHFGPPIAFSSLPCAFWKVPPVEQPHPVHAAGAPPIVVIGTTRDPATPYVWAKALAHQLDSGVLVTYRSNGHTAYEHGNDCIVGAVDRYLTARTVPPAGLHCG